MTPTDTPLAVKLLSYRPDIFAHIAKQMVPPVSRQHVARTARDPRKSARVAAVLKFYARYRRMP